MNGNASKTLPLFCSACSACLFECWKKPRSKAAKQGPKVSEIYFKPFCHRQNQKEAGNTEKLKEQNSGVNGNFSWFCFSPCGALSTIYSKATGWNSFRGFYIVQEWSGNLISMRRVLFLKVILECNVTKDLVMLLDNACSTQSYSFKYIF